MAGTREGGLRAAATNKARYGDDFYKIVGGKGGSAPASDPKGFAAQTPEFRSRFGKIGGANSRRGKSFKGFDNLMKEYGLEDEQ